MEKSTRTRNPFRIVEHIGEIAGTVLFVAFVLAGFGLLLWAVAGRFDLGWFDLGWFDLGWWVLLLIPGIPVGAIVLAIIVGFIRMGFEWIGDRWRDARYRWDENHSDSGPDEPTLDRQEDF